MVMAVAMAGVVALIAPGGASAALDCGDALDRDVKLKEDLDCSAYNGDALVIDANNVEVNLNGFRLIGPPADYSGVTSDGFNDLTVKNGTIKGFDYSIYLYNPAEDIALRDLNLKLQGTNDGYGVYVGNAKNLSVSHVDIDNADYAVYIYSSRRNTNVSHVRVTGSDPAVTYAIYIGTGTTGNYTGTVHDVKANGAYYGFYVYGTTTGFEVTDSVANNAGYAGFYVANGSADPRKYTLSDNTANGAGTYGFFADKNVPGSGNGASGAGTADCVKVHCT
jgi:hypothetical protein